MEGEKPTENSGNPEPRRPREYDDPHFHDDDLDVDLPEYHPDSSGRPPARRKPRRRPPPRRHYED